MSITNVDVVRARYVEEFEELLEVWRTVDNKAQGTAAISGIIIAGASVLFRAGGDNPVRVFLVFVSVEMFVLVLAIILSIVTLLVRQSPLPIAGEQADRIWAAGEASETLRIETEIDIYRSKNKRLHERVIKKGHLLMAAQWCVLVGAAMILPLISSFLFCNVAWHDDL